jgi:cobalt-zinc-cadmium efflux system protein
MPCADHDHDHDAHGHGHSHSHGHAHGLSLDQFDRAMAAGVGLNTLFVIIEFAAGFWAGSLALVADAGHNAGDVVGLLLAWGASQLARRPPSRRYTWGFRRTTIYAALANAVLLLTACGAIVWEAWHRLQSPEPVAGPVMIAVATVGVAINTLTALLFMRGRERDANLRGAFLHMAADAAVSAGVVVAGIAIMMTGWTWIDPLVSIAITLAIVVGTWDLFRESIDLSLDAVPRGIDPDAIKEALAAIFGVVEVHDLHVWAASTSEVTLTAHLVVPDKDLHEAALSAATALLRDRFRIAHTTIQLEREEAGEAVLVLGARRRQGYPQVWAVETPAALVLRHCSDEHGIRHQPLQHPPGHVQRAPHHLNLRVLQLLGIGLGDKLLHARQGAGAGHGRQ